MHRRSSFSLPSGAMNAISLFSMFVKKNQIRKKKAPKKCKKANRKTLKIAKKA